MKKDLVKRAPSGIIFLGLIAIQVLAIFGLLYLTKFAFTTPANEVSCLKMTTFERNVSRMTIVLQWISVASVLLIGIMNVM